MRALLLCATVLVGVSRIYTPEDVAMYRKVVRNAIESRDVDRVLSVESWVSKESGARPLHVAATHGFVEETRTLLRMGADARIKTSDYGLTPLHAAAYFDKPDVVAVLLEDGNVDKDAVSNRGHTPLAVALNRRREKVVGILLDHGVNLGVPIDEADVGELQSFVYRREIKTQWAGLVSQAIETGDVNRVLFDEPPGTTALHMTAELGLVEETRILLRMGADPTAQTSDSSVNPLHVAAVRGNLEIVEILLEDKRLDVDTVDQQKRTALQIAVNRRNMDVARLLLDHGPKILAPLVKGDDIVMKELLDSRRRPRRSWLGWTFFVGRWCFLLAGMYIGNPILSVRFQKYLGMKTKFLDFVRLAGAALRNKRTYAEFYSEVLLQSGYLVTLFWAGPNPLHVYLNFGFEALRVEVVKGTDTIVHESLGVHISLWLLAAFYLDNKSSFHFFVYCVGLSGCYVLHTVICQALFARAKRRYIVTCINRTKGPVSTGNKAFLARPELRHRVEILCLVIHCVCFLLPLYVYGNVIGVDVWKGLGTGWNNRINMICVLEISYYSMMNWLDCLGYVLCGMTGCPIFVWCFTVWMLSINFMNENCNVCNKCMPRELMRRDKECRLVYCSKECAKKGRQNRERIRAMLREQTLGGT